MVRLLLICLVATLVVRDLLAEPIPLGKGSQPRVVSDGQKHIAVVFGQQNKILISDSRDGGASFSDARILDSGKSMPLGMRRGPRAAMTPKTMVVTAIDSDSGENAESNIWAWLSTDAGTTWSKSNEPLNSVNGSAREGLQNVAASADGTVVAVWLYLRNVVKGSSGTEVWMNLSKDGGVTWQGDRLVYRHQNGSVCECCHPSVVVDSKHRIHVMFRHSKDGFRDMYLTTSSDEGRTFSDPQKLGQGAWKLKGCPMDGGDLTLDTNGDVVTVWQRDGTIYSSMVGKPEVQLGKGRQPIILASSGAAWSAWTLGNAMVVQAAKGEGPNLRDGANFPSAVAAEGDRVALAWQANQEVFFELLPTSTTLTLP